MRVKNNFPATKSTTANMLIKTKSLIEAGELSAAEKKILQLIKKDPDSLEVQYIYGTILYLNKKYLESIKILSKIVESMPDAINIRLNYGAALFEVGRYEDAIEQYNNILKVDPNHVIALNNLGGTYKLLMRIPESQKTLERSIEIDPNYHIAQYNLGSIYYTRKMFQKAKKQFEKALELKFTASAYHSLLNVTDKIDAKEAYNLAIKATKLQNPGVALIAAFPILYRSCNWDIAKNIQNEVMKIIEEEGSNATLEQGVLLMLNNLNNVSRENIFDMHRGWGEKISRYVEPYSEYSKESGSKRLRIGYLSPDFREHSVGFFIRNIIARHDKNKFEVYCYSNSKHDDAITKEIRKSCTAFSVIYNLSDQELAEKIHNDGIHLLIDLAGHTGDSRVTVLSYKAAPIQITYLGYPNTTGLTTVDYRITDNYAEDDDQGTFYTEKLIRMPESFLCFGEFNNFSISSNMAVQRKGYITFGSFNNINKLSQETIYVWSQILNSVPLSKLIIKSSNVDKDYIKNNIYKEFKANGIDNDRIELYGFKAKKDDHLLLYDEIDIALDTFPYNGTTTTCEALWMDVPVVTLVGEKHSQRVSYSILKNIFVEDTITYTIEEYISKAVTLATDIELLRAVKDSIHKNLRESILCDPTKFTHQLENEYVRIWKEKEVTLPWENLSAKEEVYTPDISQMTVDMKENIKVCVPDDINLITPYVLLEQKDWFEIECDFVRHILKSGMKFIDIGANYGMYTLMAAKYVGNEGRVWAFEPAKPTMAYLTKSLVENNFHNVELIEAGISDKSGNACITENINAELNMILEASEDAISGGETIELLSMDDSMKRFKWENIDFIKIDAEGFEDKVIDGGGAFFDKNSPLVMYEIKHGNDWNIDLVRKFEAIGFTSYKLIPGLKVLVPFDPTESIDKYQLNLFCCKVDRAGQLAQDGLLIKEPISLDEIGAPKPASWINYLQQFPYVIHSLQSWLEFTGTNNQHLPWIMHQQALDFYAQAHDVSEPIEKRYAYLLCAFHILFNLLKENGNFSNILTFVRIATEIGERVKAVNALTYLINAHSSGHIPMILNEPFLAITPEYENLDPNEEINNWAMASILEQHEKLRSFSSYYTGTSSISTLEAIRVTGFQSEEMERREELIRRRFKL